MGVSVSVYPSIFADGMGTGCRHHFAPWRMDAFASIAVSPGPQQLAARLLPEGTQCDVGTPSPLAAQALLEGLGYGSGHHCALCLRREGAMWGMPERRKSSDKIKGPLSHAEEPGGWMRGERRGHPGFKHSASAPDPGTFREHFLNLSPVFLTHKQFPHP